MWLLFDMPSPCNRPLQQEVGFVAIEQVLINKDMYIYPFRKCILFSRFPYSVSHLCQDPCTNLVMCLSGSLYRLVMSLSGSLYQLGDVFIRVTVQAGDVFVRFIVPTW